MRSLFLSLFIFASSFSFAQSPEEEIDPEHLNTAYLEHLIKIKIDSVRHSKGLSELVNDSILYLASLHHSKQMGRTRTLSHYEAAAKYKNPQKRAEAFGAENYFTGENVAFLTAYKKMFVKRPEMTQYFSYGEFATRMVKGWVRSRGHYRNIIRKEYQVTGVSIYYDRKSQKIYATQKFAEIKSRFVFSENTAMFPYADDNEIEYELKEMKQVARKQHRGRHRWGLKERGKFRRCRECDAVLRQKESFRFYADTAGNIHCLTMNGPLFKQLTRRRRDGLAVEIVNYRDYTCDNKNYFLKPSRRNGQCIANGTIQKPVYKWKLRKTYRKDKRAWNKDKWTKIRKILLGFEFKKYGDAFEDMMLKFPGTPSDNIIGQLPLNDSDYFECNILFLKKKRICNIMHFTDYCGEKFNGVKELPLLPELSQAGYNPPEDTLKYEFMIFFKQGKSEYNYEDIRPLLDTLQIQNYSIGRLEINATASVEGDAELNRKLTRKRARSISEALGSARADTLISAIRYEEDWRHFYRHIANTEYAYLLKLDRQAIKEELLNPDVAKDLSPILEQERKAVVKLLLIRKTEDSVRVKQALGRYRELSDSAIAAKPSAALATRLLQLQTFLYNKVTSGNLPASALTEVVPSQDKIYAKLYLNHIVFRHNNDPSGDPENSVNELYPALREAVLSKKASQVQLYNFLNLLIGNWNTTWYDTTASLSPRRVFALLSRLNSAAIPADTLEQLKMNFYFRAANWFHFTEPDNNYQLRAMNAIYAHYRRENYNDTVAYRIARYFIYYQRDGHAYRILAPFALSKDPRPEVFALFLKMAFLRDMYRNRSRFYKLIKTAPVILGRDAFCDLFTGPCNINFQVFDKEEIRSVWCAHCKDFKNFADRYGEKARQVN